VNTNEPPSSIKGEEYLDRLRHYSFLIKSVRNGLGVSEGNSSLG
jgi:hypothetical protein